METLESISVRLREAVATGSHREAAAILQQYSRALEQLVHRLNPQDPRLPELAREAFSLIEWARRSTLAQRAGYAARLAKTRDIRPYGPPAGRSHAWTFVV